MTTVAKKLITISNTIISNTIFLQPLTDSDVDIEQALKTLPSANSNDGLSIYTMLMSTVNSGRNQIGIATRYGDNHIVALVTSGSSTRTFYTSNNGTSWEVKTL